MDRRTALSRLVMTAGALGLGGLAVACEKKPAELSCTDTSGLTPDDLKTRRELLVYVDKSPDPTKKCSACALYKPAAPNTCGACSLVKGPINPDGSCKSFAPKPA
jgi:hypothetical protein